MDELSIKGKRKEIWRSNGLNPDCYSNAVGQAMQEYAELWDRDRDRWNYLPSKPKFNKNVCALTSLGRVVLSFIDGSGEFDLHECDQYEDENGEFETIIAWQYYPEPPKE